MGICNFGIPKHNFGMAVGGASGSEHLLPPDDDAVLLLSADQDKHPTRVYKRRWWILGAIWI